MRKFQKSYFHHFWRKRILLKQKNLKQEANLIFLKKGFRKKFDFYFLKIKRPFILRRNRKCWSKKKNKKLIFMKTLIKMKVSFDKKIHGFVFKEKGFSFKRSHDLFEKMVWRKKLYFWKIFFVKVENWKTLFYYFFKKIHRFSF